MFIVTAKLNKGKIIGALLFLVVLAAIVIICTSVENKDAPTASIGAVVKNNEQRVAYLKSFGWDVSEKAIDEQTITIPKTFSAVYAEYNTIQKEQGFDLTKYSGLEAVRYTYEVTNHPIVSESVVADIIVYRNQVIAGDIQCFKADGFMAGLKFPEAETK